MSRASDLRDALIAELEDRFPSETIEAFAIPDYEAEELRGGRRIGVRINRRTLDSNQGPDVRTVQIDVGVFGDLGKKESSSKSAYREQVVEKIDDFDDLVEELIALWTPDGPLCGIQAGLANHRFSTIEQPVVFDDQQLYAMGLYVSMIRLTYIDQEDEAE